MAKGLLRKKLLSSLDERELAGLVGLLSKTCRPFNGNLSHISYLAGFDTRTLFGILHKRLFDRWESNNLAFLRVMENLKMVRQILREIPVKIPSLEPEYPPIPDNFQIGNQEAQVVFVTAHAWDRFW